MEEILKHMNNLDKLTFGGNEKDVFIDYELKIPKEATKIINNVIDLAADILMEFIELKDNWFLEENKKKLWSIEKKLLIFFNNVETIDDLKSKIKDNISICGGYVSDLAVNKELGWNVEPKDLDIFISQDFIDIFLLFELLKKTNDPQKAFDEFNEEYRFRETDVFESLRAFFEILYPNKCKEVLLEESRTYSSFVEVKAVVKTRIDGIKVDFISANLPNIEEIVLSFDFSFRKFYFDGENVKAAKGALYDLRRKILHVNQPDGRLRTLLRGFEFERKYGFEFKEINKKLLMNIYFHNELFEEESYNIALLAIKYDKKHIEKIIKDAMIDLDKWYDLKEDIEIEKKSLEFISKSIKKDEYISQKRFFEELVFRKITMFEKYNKKNEKEIKSLVDWVICSNSENILRKVRVLNLSLPSQTSMNQDNIPNMKNIVDELENFETENSKKEKELLSAIEFQLERSASTNHPKFYYSEILNYYIEYNLNQYLAWKKNISINPLGIPKNIYKKEKIEIGNKSFTRRELLTIRNKLRYYLNFANLDKNEYDYINKISEFLVKLGIVLTDETDILDKPVSGETLELLIALDIIYQQEKQDKGVQVVKNSVSPEGYINAFYATKFTLSQDIGLEELIGRDEICLRIENEDFDFEYVGYITFRKKELKAMYKINHPLRKSIKDCSFEEYNKKYAINILDQVESMLPNKFNLEEQYEMYII